MSSFRRRQLIGLHTVHVDDWRWVWKIDEVIRQKEAEVLDKLLFPIPSCFVHYRSHMDEDGIEPACPH